MADEDYRRLAAACACGEPLKLSIGPGRPRKYCRPECRPSQKHLAEQSWKGTRQCLSCLESFTAKKPDHEFCSLPCRTAVRLRKPKASALTCRHCSKQFEPSRFIAGANTQYFCGARCKKASWVESHPTAECLKRKPKPAVLCAYYAAYCVKCGAADGGRRPWALCHGCVRHKRLDEQRSAARAASDAVHRAQGKVVCCSECNVEFCPLYGEKLRSTCAVCAHAKERRLRREAKSKRAASKRGCASETVSPIKVFERDGWRCKLCGIETPRALRGLPVHNAPELDHVVPLSKGGPHTYANTQCLCRSCNGWKAARTMEEVEAELLA